MGQPLYLGGHPRMRKSAKGTFRTARDGVRFMASILNRFKLPYSDITIARAMTEEQVSKDVTLTRLLLIGVFAFGAKKKRVTRTDVLSIECRIDGVETTVMFRDDKAHEHAAGINRRVRECGRRAIGLS